MGLYEGVGGLWENSAATPHAEAFRPERGGEREEGENSNTPDPKGSVDIRRKTFD